MAFNLLGWGAVSAVCLIGAVNRAIYRRMCNPRSRSPLTLGSPKTRFWFTRRLPALSRQKIAFINTAHSQLWWICGEERHPPLPARSQKMHWVKVDAASVRSIYGDALPVQISEYCQRFQAYLKGRAWEFAVRERDLGLISELEVASLVQWTHIAKRRAVPQFRELEVESASVPLPEVLALFRGKENDTLHLMWYSSPAYRAHLASIRHKLSGLIEFDHVFYPLTFNDLVDPNRPDVVCVMCFSPEDGFLSLVTGIRTRGQALTTPISPAAPELVTALSKELFGREA